MTQHAYDKAAAAAELESFKQQPIVELAVAMGWKVTADKGTDSFNIEKGSLKVRTFKGKTSWMWKCFQGEGPAGRVTGTVVDLAIEETGSIGKARLLLRSLTGTSAPVSYQPSSSPVPSSTCPDSAISAKTYKSSDEVLAEFKTGARIWEPGYLLPKFMSERGVRHVPPVFNNRFAVTTDFHRAARFLYVNFNDAGDLVAAGSEDRNVASEPGGKSFRSYSKDGRAGFWHAPGDKGAAIIVTESPLDAISCELIREADGIAAARVGYVSVRSGSEAAVIKYLISKIENGTNEVLVSTDNNAAGMAYAAKIMSGLEQAKRDQIIPAHVSVLYFPAPEGHVDWNDALRAHRARQFREAGSESRSNGGLSPRPEPRPAPRTRTPDPTAPCPA